MAVFKCKMCGGTLAPEAGSGIARCEYCGSRQTLPKTADDIMANLFNRANNLRLKGEFDRSAEIYERLIAQDDTNAEAHWGLVLCRYGVEYVEDPKTGTRIPTCHRTCLEPVTKDEDYRAALDYADEAGQKLYEQEARVIDRLQRDILAVVKEEKPFDVFICYKETDDQGKRTVDSSIANDIYHQLTMAGLKVFYAAITLEDKLGQAYEPYIFAALNSSKVMLVLGTRPEYFNAVWVKNEWGRFLKLAAKDKSKLLIPCYRNMDPYELPEEFSHLQAQDMSKIGFINDVIRGIQKVVGAKQTTAATSTQSEAPDTAPLLRRAFMFLEDGDWKSADEYCEKVLDREPENADAYLGKLMVQLQVRKQADLANYPEPFDQNSNYKKILRFGSDQLKQMLAACANLANTRTNVQKREDIYIAAIQIMDEAEQNYNITSPFDTARAYKQAGEMFASILDYFDAEEKYRQCVKEANRLDKKNKAYSTMITCVIGLTIATVILVLILILNS